ncbi:MAG: hypothetical protein PVG71_09575 [Anaerolineae bacterium]|jgi:hypothetical protein
MAESPDLSGVASYLSRPVYRYHQYQGYSNDCGPTSLAIAANALLGREAFQGPDVARQMSHVAFEWRPLPHVVIQRIPNWATFPWGIVYYLKKHDLPARWGPFGTVERLRSNLLANQITIVVVGEPWSWRKGRYAGWAHVKILFGHTPGQGFLFVDPGHSRADDPWKRHGLFWQEESEFLRQWRNLFRTYVEVG